MNLKFKVKLTHVLISLAVFIIFTATVLPSEATQSAARGLTESIDTAFLYTPNRLYEIISNYSLEVRMLYIYQRFTFDLIWPLVYGSFIVISTWYLIDRLDNKKWQIFKLLPLIAISFDFLENILVSLLMYLYPFKSLFLGYIASSFTTLKWVTLSTSFILILGLTLFVTSKTIWRKLHQ